MATSADMHFYSVAKMLLDEHAEGARLEATRMLNLMTANNDFEGRQLWRRICDVLEACAEAKQKQR